MVKNTNWFFSLVAVAAVGIFPLPAKAAFMSGNALLAQCKGTSLHQIQCMSYIIGVADAQSGLLEGAPIKSTKIPSGVTPGQLQGIVVKYLEGHPEMLHYEAAQLVHIALDVAFRS